MYKDLLVYCFIWLS